MDLGETVSEGVDGNNVSSLRRNDDISETQG
jgi:hypothetical protein